MGRVNDEDEAILALRTFMIFIPEYSWAEHCTHLVTYAALVYPIAIRVSLRTSATIDLLL